MKEYSKMTPAEKRVAICQDVQAKIKARHIIPAHKGYINALEDDVVNIDLTYRPTDSLFSEWADVCCAVKDHGKCLVCADGALFISAVDKAGLLEDCETAPLDIQDAFYGEDKHVIVNEFDGIVFFLSGIFDKLTLAIIEAAYERNDAFNAPLFREKDRDMTDDTPDVAFPSIRAKRAVEFGYRYDDPAARMMAITQHIIDNQGEWTV